MIGFDFYPRTRFIFGEGCASRLGELARELSGRRVLLVTDPGIQEAGHADRAARALRDAGLTVTLFDGVIENPTTDEVERCVAVARTADIDSIVGLGGGSAMDTAKGCNFLLTNGGRMEDYWGVGKATKPMLPLIAIPTTAGTGSESQSFALIAQAATHAKMACGDPKAAARVALLDPMLTLTQPREVTARTGLDAISHAVESAVSRRRNEISGLYSREAFRLTMLNFPRVLDQPDNIEARAGMQLGAALAGLAIENSMLGAAHALANPLTARYGIIHGQAVGMMLPAVVRFNGAEPGARGRYAELARAAGLTAGDEPEEAAADRIAAGLEAMLDAAGLPRSLEACGVARDTVAELAEQAAAQWTAGFNPRPVDAEALAGLYSSTWEGAFEK